MELSVSGLQGISAFGPALSKQNHDGYSASFAASGTPFIACWTHEEATAGFYEAIYSPSSVPLRRQPSYAGGDCFRRARHALRHPIDAQDHTKKNCRGTERERIWHPKFFFCSTPSPPRHPLALPDFFTFFIFEDWRRAGKIFLREQREWVCLSGPSFSPSSRLWPGINLRTDLNQDVPTWPNVCGFAKKYKKIRCRHGYLGQR